MGREDISTIAREDIPREDLNALRGILVSSLSRENLGPLDPPAPPPRRRRSRKVHFQEGDLESESAGDTPGDPRSSSKPDKEERLKILRERQNEERQKKLEELRQQALAAQKFREQKEEERRRRLEELRTRDTDRRHQVEERKRQIWEAERDRREAILRKNQEREARLESKRKNERSTIVFAFGSSTPRMLEPGDTGSAYWATRRATSTTNVMTMSMSATQPGPLTRRSSERELDGGSKKRATSAGCVERKPNDADVRRKKTDLSPVFRGASVDLSPRGRSKPGRAYSMSRLDVLSRPRPPPPPASEGKGSPHQQEGGGRGRGGGGEDTEEEVRRPLRRGAAVSMVHLPPPRPTRAERLRKKAREQQARSQSLDQPTSPGARSGDITPSRPTSSLSQHSVSSQLSAVSLRMRTTPRKPRPISIAVTGVSSPGSDRGARSPNVSSTEKPPIPKVHSAKKSTPSKNDTTPKRPTKSAKSSTSTTPKGSTTPLQSPMVESVESSLGERGSSEEKISEEGGGGGSSVEAGREKASPPRPTSPPPPPPPGAHPERQPEPPVEPASNRPEPVRAPEQPEPIKAPEQPEPVKAPLEPLKAHPAASPRPSENSVSKNQLQSEPLADLSEADMTASMIAKTRITTEEEAKAALAERRRLAREQAEREAELERQRLEAERLADEERQRKEEEDQRRMEEEQLRLLEEARQSEEIRLNQAIEEAKKREEEEKKRKEDELKQKLEREEAEKKAKEEAEKQRIEMEIRLKKEEEDRQARRKRVEAIMLRTRGRGSTASPATQSKDGDEPESEENSPPDEVKKATRSEHDDFLNSERSHSEANTDALPPPPAPAENSNKHNGHHNGSIEPLSENNVSNSLLDLSGPGDILEHPAGNGKLPETHPFIENSQSHQMNDLLS